MPVFYPSAARRDWVSFSANGTRVYSISAGGKNSYKYFIPRKRRNARDQQVKVTFYPDLVPSIPQRQRVINDDDHSSKLPCRIFTNFKNQLVRTSCTGAAIVRVNTNIINSRVSFVRKRPKKYRKKNTVKESSRSNLGEQQYETKLHSHCASLRTKIIFHFFDSIPYLIFFFHFHYHEFRKLHERFGYAEMTWKISNDLGNGKLFVGMPGIDVISHNWWFYQRLLSAMTRRFHSYLY